MPPIAHVVKGSMFTYELSIKVLGLIHEGLASWQLVDDQGD
jgi:hypothetical protein